MCRITDDSLSDDTRQSESSDIQFLPGGIKNEWKPVGVSNENQLSSQQQQNEKYTQDVTRPTLLLVHPSPTESNTPQTSTTQRIQNGEPLQNENLRPQQEPVKCGTQQFVAGGELCIKHNNHLYCNRNDETGAICGLDEFPWTALLLYESSEYRNLVERIHFRGKRKCSIID